MNIRWVLAGLVVLALLLQGELWFSKEGYRKTRGLRSAVEEQRAVNSDLKARNAALDAEVINLKEGVDAAEERARTDLGLIGENETFYQVVDSPDY